MRRLPIYFLVDVSESMVDHLDDVSKGMQMLQDQLSVDPYALETAYISLIVFAGKPKVIIPLTEIISFPRLESLPLGGGTSLGSALDCLMNEIDQNVTVTTESQKGDWKPIVFLFTDGMPTDSYQSSLNKWKSRYANKASLIAISLGNNIEYSILGALTENVYSLEKLEPGDFKEFFQWITNTIKVTSVSISADSTSNVQIQELSDSSPLKRINLRKSDNNLEFMDEFKYIIGKCAQTNKRYLAKFLKNSQRRYDPVGTFPLPDENIYDELTIDQTIGHNLQTQDIDHDFDKEYCPHCNNPIIFNQCMCGNLFCSNGTDSTLTCPWCGFRGQYQAVSNLNVGSLLG